MNAIISDVVREIGKYAHLAPSLSLSADIIREADNRRRNSLPASMQSPRPWPRIVEDVVDDTQRWFVGDLKWSSNHMCLINSI
jgi:hypothetical protein